MTYEEALKNIRKKFPNWLIHTVWEFENAFYFRLSATQDFSVYDTSAIRVSVDRSTGVINTYGSGDIEIDPNKDKERAYKYHVASCYNDRPVDITEEQYKKLDESRKLIKAYYKYQKGSFI